VHGAFGEQCQDSGPDVATTAASAAMPPTAAGPARPEARPEAGAGSETAVPMWMWAGPEERAEAARPAMAAAA